MPLQYGDRYHGEVRTEDLRLMWVFRRLHRGSGWCVEVRDGAPDGPLLDRSWHQSGADAATFVDGTRSLLSRQTRSDYRGQIIEAPGDRGIVVAHVGRVRRHAMVRIDDGVSQPVCAVYWLAPGSHEVALIEGGKGAIVERTVDVATHHALHVFVTSWPVVVPAALALALPLWHRCRARRVAFDGSSVPGRALCSSGEAHRC